MKTNSLVSRALAAHVTAPLSSGRAARSRRKSQPGYFLFGSVGRLPGNSKWTQLGMERTTTSSLVSFQPFPSEEVKTRPDTIMETHTSDIRHLRETTNSPTTVIMREMAPIGEMAPGCGKRSKKHLIVFSHPHRRDGTGCDLNDVNPRVSVTVPGPRGDIRALLLSRTITIGT